MFDDEGAILESHPEAQERSDDLPLPPLPSPVLPQLVEGQPLEEMYDVIIELRRQLEEEDKSLSSIKYLLSNDPKVLLAVCSVLHQSGHMKRRRMDETGNVVTEQVPLPEAVPPPLPPGFNSWIVKGPQ